MINGMLKSNEQNIHRGRRRLAMNLKVATVIALGFLLTSALFTVSDVTGVTILAGSSSTNVAYQGANTLSAMVSQGGYLQNGPKKAVINCSGYQNLTMFYLRNDSGDYVYSSYLYYWGYYSKWKAYYWIADFTDFQVEGNYSVVVPYESGSIESFRFPISNSTYIDLLQMAQEWFYYQRCGCEVPGWHDACHLDDGVREGSWINATGGWHDAGDYNKYVYSTVLAVFALETLYEDYHPLWNEYGSAQPDTIEEAQWGMDWLLKMLTPDGYLWSAVFSGYDYWGIPEPETDNVPGTSDDRPFTKDQWGDVTWAEAFFSADAAKLAYLKESEDPGYADMLRQKAELTFNVVLSRPGMVYPSLDAQAGLLLASTYLCLLTHASKYLDTAYELVDRILACQMPEGWFAYPGSIEPVFNHFTYMDMVVALEQFAVKFPNDQIVPQIKDALRRFMNHVCLMTQETPFGQMANLIMYKGSLQVWNFMPTDVWGLRWQPGFYQGLDSIYALTAYCALLANRIVGVNASYTEVAQNQISWILGMNPVDYSMMAGVGRNPAGYHTRYNSIPSHSDGIIPGGIVNGICGNLSDYYWFDDSAGTPAWQTTEYWLPHNAWFTVALESLITNNFTMPYPTDLNRDGIVNILDMTIAAGAFGSRPGDLNWNATADIDKNGWINILDIVKVAIDFGKTI
jgi:hypothetical protein